MAWPVLISGSIFYVLIGVVFCNLKVTSSLVYSERPKRRWVISSSFVAAGEDITSGPSVAAGKSEDTTSGSSEAAGRIIALASCNTGAKPIQKILLVMGISFGNTRTHNPHLRRVKLYPLSHTSTCILSSHSVKKAAEKKTKRFSQKLILSKN